MYIFMNKKSGEWVISTKDRLTPEQALSCDYSLVLNDEWDWGECDEFINNYFDIVNNKVVFWDLQKQYDNGILKLNPYSKIDNGFVVPKTRQELINDNVYSLDEVKTETIKQLSNDLLTKRSQLIPDYKIINSVLDLYTSDEKAEILSIVEKFRNEFYRMKALIEYATDVNDIDTAFKSLNLPTTTTVKVYGS